MAEVEAQLIETPTGEGDAIVVTLPGDEIEAPSSDAVAIAEIEANKEITIAAIHADVATTEIEARAEGEIERDERWHELQSQLANLTGQVASLSETVAALSILPALLPVAETVEEPGTEELPGTETNLTPPSMKVETSETPTEVIDVSEAEKPEAPPVQKRRLRFL